MNNIWNKITQLARIKMSEKEEKTLVTQVKNTMVFFEHISSVSTESVEPLTTPFSESLPFRKDEKKHFKQDLLQSAPSLEGRYIQVPKVISTSKKDS